jgi:hypothetical protein
MVNGIGPASKTCVKMLPNNKFLCHPSQEKRVWVQKFKVQRFKVQRFRGSKVQRFKGLERFFRILSRKESRN